MPTKHQVAVIVGSLRAEGFNRWTARVLEAVAPVNLEFKDVGIGHLPLYNQDLDDEPPAAWLEFRTAVRACDAILFVTPEHNRGLPAALKNALDIGSRPYGQSVWDGKPGAIVTVSPGAVGGFGANHQLRQSLVFLNVLALAQPEAYIGGAGKLFDEKGNLTDERTREFLSTFMSSFGAWIERHKS